MIKPGDLVLYWFDYRPDPADQTWADAWNSWCLLSEPSYNLATEIVDDVGLREPCMVLAMKGEWAFLLTPRSTTGWIPLTNLVSDWPY